MLFYRPDIDGLRAVAVLAVIFYHLGWPYMPGGYAGVDVFFVISGFLITSIILQKMNEGTFSLTHFYERRIRRILPPLFCVLFVSLIMGAVLLFPADFKDFGWSLMATVMFASNILFWDTAGYFEPDSALRPLLHTWSLGVEEQFYILFPLALVMTARISGRLVPWLIVAGFIVCFLIGWWGIYIEKFWATFYLLPPRGWELLMGAILALPLFPKLKNAVLLNAAGVCGAACLAYTFLFYNDETPFPGPYALPPVIGAALLIYAGMSGRTVFARLLSLPPMVLIGKMSYSLYLWHWPLLAFYKYAALWPLGWHSDALILALTFALSFLTWRYVERPFHKQNILSRRTIFAGAAGFSLAFLLVGWLIVSTGGLPQRYSERMQKLADITLGLDEENTTAVQTGTFMGTGEFWDVGTPQAKRSFLVWGDSNAWAALPAIHATATKYNTRGYAAWMPGCMPFIDPVPKFDALCHAFNAHMQDFISAHAEIKTVFVIALWSGYGTSIVQHDGATPGAEAQTRVLEAAYRGLTDFLHAKNIKVVLVTNPPKTPSSNAREDLSQAYFYGREMPAAFDAANNIRALSPMYDALMRVSRDYPLNHVSLKDSVCEAATCRLMREDRVLYYDREHLSTYGALLTRDAYDAIFKTHKENLK